MWLSSKNGEGISDVLCSGKDCYPGGDCSKNREIVEWEGNPRFVGDTPDSLAPVNYPQEVEAGGALMRAGTSFATPVVSGGIANIIEVLQESDVAVNPAQIRRYTRLTGQEVEESPATLFDSYSVMNEILEDNGKSQVYMENDDDEVDV